MTANSDPVGDKERLLLVAGFAFGVMTTMVLLVLVLGANGAFGPGSLLASSDALIVIAGIVFTGIVGVALYVLSFAENRQMIPIAADDQE